MARHKNANWNLNDPVKSWEELNSALLMDIRDELQKLNNTLACYRVSRMSDDINRIERRLQRNMPLQKRKAKA